MKKVEQVNRDGKVVIQADSIYSKDEIYTILSKLIPSIQKERSYFTYFVDNEKYYLLIKNITYLGHPHPLHKKRIQVSSKWSQILRKEKSFLIGIYHFSDNIVFALFDKKQRGKNSSAHISTIDILKAVELGIFQKIDKQNNNLIVFREDKFCDVIDLKIHNKKIINSEEIHVFDEFSGVLEKRWDGIKSYKKMIASNFSQALQSEWPGFYFEYMFERFINSNPQYKNICVYVRNKKVGSLDFDVEFVRGGFYGDLKTHSVSSGSILGNDKASVEKVINYYNKLWYVVLELVPRKDYDFNCIVSKFWNTQLKKDDLLSYCGRMKHDVSLTQFYILEINKFNKKYISDFRQPRNSNGDLREIKIKIDKKNIDNFVIFRKTLT